MQTNLFTREQINQESSVGEFIKGSVDYDPLLKLYFNYPGVEELYLKAQQALAQNKKVVFKTKKAFKDTNPNSKSFLKDGYQKNKKLEDGLMTSHFGALLTPSISGQKILGNYSIAFIEAQASKLYHQHFHPKQEIDHFYGAQGLTNIEVLAETLKAFDIKKNSLITLLTPANAIRAFKDDKYSAWHAPQIQTDLENSSKIYLIDKTTHETKASINLVSNPVIDLHSPIYKVKVDDKWVIIVPWQVSMNSLDKVVDLEVTNNLIDQIKNNKKTKDESDNKETVYLDASLGQASRVIFELFGGEYENLPEAMLNFEGGSWSSISLENSSSSRYQGINSMHEVLYNKWYEHQDIAIPWNYLGFDKLDSQNKKLLEDPNIFVLSLEDNDKNIDAKDCYIEANQSWKKILGETTKYLTKFVYREYSAIASKKYLLSTKEIMQLTAKFLANWSINGFNNKSQAYQDKIKEEKIPSELVELLECVAYTHTLLSAEADFHSTKTHISNIKRLKRIAKIQKKLEKLCPIPAKNLKQKIYNLLQKDIKTELCTLWSLYKNELDLV